MYIIDRHNGRLLEHTCTEVDEIHRQFTRQVLDIVYNLNNYV